MEPLLNIKEAAALLHVSEMTMRRWTNAGLLPCYRIGRKRERRFSPEALRKYLTATAYPGHPTGPATLPGGGLPLIPLGYGTIKVADGTHLTHFYAAPEEALEVQLSYVRQGLLNDETVLVVAAGERQRLLLERLEGRGMDVAGLRARNRLHLSGGKKTPGEMAAYLTTIVASVPGRFRLVGEMIWARKQGWSAAELRQLEEWGDSRRSAGRLFLCQYSLKDFSGQETMMAAETHSHVLYRQRLRNSPFAA